MKEKTSSDTTTKHFLTLTDVVKTYLENDSFNPKNHLNLIEMHFSVKKSLFCLKI